MEHFHAIKAEKAEPSLSGHNKWIKKNTKRKAEVTPPQGKQIIKIMGISAQQLQETHWIGITYGTA